MNKSSLLPVTFAVACVYIGYCSPAMAMGRCPTEEERLANAEIVVEAGVKSVFVGDSGFLDEDANPIRIMRADLDVRTVLKGKFTGNAATVYDEAYDSALGPLDALSTMASLYAAGGGYTLTVELSRQKPSDLGIEMFVLNSCSYLKLPNSIERVTAGQSSD